MNMQAYFGCVAVVSLLLFNSSTHARWIDGGPGGSDAEIVFVDASETSSPAMEASCVAARKGGYTCDWIGDDLLTKFALITDARFRLLGTHETLQSSVTSDRLPPKAVGVFLRYTPLDSADRNNKIPFLDDLDSPISDGLSLNSTDFDNAEMDLDNTVIYLDSQSSARDIDSPQFPDEVIYKNSVIAADAATFIGPGGTPNLPFTGPTGRFIERGDSFKCFWEAVLEDRVTKQRAFDRCLKPDKGGAWVLAGDGGEFPPPTSEFVKFSVLWKTVRRDVAPVECGEDQREALKFTARLKHDKAGDKVLKNLKVRVRTLGNDNRLFIGNDLLEDCRRLLEEATWTEPEDENALQRFAVPTDGGFADGRLSYGESVDVDFTVCLTNRDPFELTVDVVEGKPASSRYCETDDKIRIDDYAKKHGFSESDYPYYEGTNKCGAEPPTDNVPNGWHVVSFEKACNAHDKCYMRLGSSASECNKKFLSDLSAACWKYIWRPISYPSYTASPLDKIIWASFPINPPFLRPNFLNPANQTANVASCLTVAGLYAGAVEAVAHDYHPNRQKHAKEYNELVRGFMQFDKHSGKWINIMNLGSGKCLDVTDWSKEDGANIQQWGCKNDSNQLFKLIMNEDGWVNIKNQGSEKCLDVTGWSDEDGANIQQWGCKNDSNQLFRLIMKEDGWVNIENQGSGKCQDVTGWSKEDGANIQQWGCKNDSNQLFTLVSE